MAVNSDDQSSEANFFINAHVTEAQEQAYALGADSNNIIAILDTGLTADVANTNLTSLNDIISSYQVDYLSFDNTPEDEYEDYRELSTFNKGHGTVIALIAHSVAPQAEILPIRVCDEEGHCPTSSVILGICHAANVAAAQNKKLIMNMSFSGTLEKGFAPKHSLLYQVLNLVLSPDVLAITEVGNRGLDLRPRFPAAFSDEGLDGVFSVSALQPDGLERQSYAAAYYSTRGAYIDVAALGSNLFIGKHIIGDGEYQGGYSGSSFATPWVTGTVSLMQETNGKRDTPLTAWELEYCLKTTTQPSTISAIEVGSGMINALEAVKCVEQFPNY
jgi:subtilisin